VYAQQKAGDGHETGCVRGTGRLGPNKGEAHYCDLVFSER
jgi:hypothetical protein